MVYSIKASEKPRKIGRCKKMIELKDVYESLEEVTDKCIDVLDVMSDIMLRYAYQGA